MSLVNPNTLSVNDNGYIYDMLILCRDNSENVYVYKTLQELLLSLTGLSCLMAGM